MRREAPPRRRTRAATALVAATAVIVFAITATLGFVATRTAAGRSWLPPTQPAPPALLQAPAVKTFTTQSAQAKSPTEETGRTFTVTVPTGWTEFVEQRTQQTQIPASTAVHWVKQDGTAELTVERFPGFYPYYDIRDYVAALTAEPTIRFAMAPPPNNQATNSTTQETQYRDEATNRTTYAELIPDNDELWVVSVTVPTDQESSGKVNLFDKIKTTFRVTS
jgi:hypothetical protein